MTIPGLLPLRTGVQRYAWGSTTAIPELLGREPDGEPVAELWVGAHPVLPSTVEVEGEELPLDVFVERHAEVVLGAGIVDRFGRLPYLAKILAAAQPLSLQAHPSIAQATEGFDREHAAGIPLDAPNRCYRDRNHKPEIIIALTPFEALCGFRPVADSLELLGRLAGPELTPWTTHLAERPDGHGLLDVVAGVLALDDARGAALAAEVRAGLDGLDGRWAASGRLLVEIAELHPTDPGIVVACLLEYVTLEPGQALFLGAGNLHAYVRGVGVEVMASSDNVLRGGLTPKHVDPEELCRIVRPAVEPVPLIEPVEVAAGVHDYPVPVEDFSVRRITSDATLPVDGPVVLLVTDGSCSVAVDDGTIIELARGDAGLVLASAARVECRGGATIWAVAASPAATAGT
ncbi:MAG: mannose-6-phosphate isomerase, class I [Actinomycetota bacterium]